MSATNTFIAIAGNPNSGKTTAFNWYTGARQHVGNYPGITVEKKEGTAHLDGKNVPLVDLPGTYSLTAYSLEEVVARRVLAEDKPGAVLDVINAGVLERNLYLTVQMLEMGVPVVLALNMMDEARAQGLRINAKKLEEAMGVKAVPTVARTGEGLKEALAASLALAEERSGKAVPLEISYGPDIDEALKAMTPLVEREKLLTGKFPARWVALKFLENDEDIMEQCRAVNAGTAAALAKIAAETSAHLKSTLNSYPEGVIADYRYGYISSVLRQGVISGADKMKDRMAYSDKMDMVLTNRFLGPLILMALLYAMYYVTFELGAYPADLLASGFEWLHGAVDAAMPAGLLKSMITSGVIDGVGGVFGFVPLIIIMFLFISFLEDSGYMARVAYMSDRIFRFFGLHGASVMPYIVSGGIAGGCAVPGVMATRTLRSPRERLATMLTAPMMSCGAKLPVFLLLVGVFFSEHQALVMFLLTLAGWFAALLTARLLRSTIIKGESTPFVMELPPYRLPTLTGILIHTWERAWQYIKKAGTIILAISILIWAGMTFPELSAEKAKVFDERKAPLEEKLAEYPYKKLSDEIAELRASIEGLKESDPRVKEAEVKIEPLQTQLDELPAGRLQSEIEDLTEQIEALGDDAKHDALKARIDQHTAALARLDENSAAAKALRHTVESLTTELEATPKGQLEARMAKLQEELDALPEKKLEAEITGIDNEKSGEALRNSYAGRIGVALEGISRPAGFDWRTNIALVAGVAAKEVVIATLGTSYSLGEVDAEQDATLADRIRSDSDWTTATAVSLLLFTLLYSPCFVTLAVIKNESGEWKWLFFSLFFNLVLAYGVSVAAYQIVSRMG